MIIVIKFSVSDARFVEFEVLNRQVSGQYRLGVAGGCVFVEFQFCFVLDLLEFSSVIAAC